MALTSLLQGAPIRSRRAKVTLITLGILGASLFYGDGVITPAISVLSAVEGLKVAAPSIDELVIPITVAVLTALFTLQRFGTGLVGRLFGPVLRSGSSSWHRRAGRGHPAPGDREGAPAQLRREVLHRSPGRGLHRAGIGGACRYRRRGAVCGHGAVRTLADSPRVVSLRLSGADTELPRAGRADRSLPGHDPQPVLPPRSRTGPAADGRAGDRRHRDRVGGRDRGRVQRHQTGDAAGVPAAHVDPPYVLARGRACLRTRRELAALRRGGRPGDRLRLGDRPRVRVRGRGDRDVLPEHDPVPRGGARAVAYPAGPDSAGRCRVRDRRARLLLLDPDEGSPRRLGPARRRRDRAQPTHDLAPRPRDRAREAQPQGGIAARLRGGPEIAPESTVYREPRSS